MKTLQFALIFIGAGCLAIAIKHFAGKGQHALAGVLVMLPVNTVIGYTLAAHADPKSTAALVPGSLIGLLAIVCMLGTIWCLARAGIQWQWQLLVAIVVWAAVAVLVERLKAWL